MTANVLLTLLWLALAFGYPGYEFTIYTFGLGLDGGAARNDAFDLQLSLGAALGIPSMAFIDHFNILFVTFAPLAWWRNAKVQMIVLGMAILNGLYMFLFVAVFLPPWILGQGDRVEDWMLGLVVSAVFLLCVILKLPVVRYRGILRNWAIGVGVVAAYFVVTAATRASQLQNVRVLRRMCVTTPGAGEPWPSGWQWEPMPFGNNEGWPLGPWPDGEKLAGCEPSADLIAAAAAELQAVAYLPLSLVLGLIVVGVGAFFVAVLRAEEPAAP
ncbi:MAG: hypothetical protein OXF55_13595 [Caldilineaceae bacterium]|nr:hypothetical protein [Caldilineaceae bacterium]